jgi:hypothetical protein
VRSTCCASACTDDDDWLGCDHRWLWTHQCKHE